MLSQDAIYRRRQQQQQHQPSAPTDDEIEPRFPVSSSPSSSSYAAASAPSIYPPSTSTGSVRNKYGTISKKKPSWTSAFTLKNASTQEEPEAPPSAPEGRTSATLRRAPRSPVKEQASEERIYPKRTSPLRHPSLGDRASPEGSPARSRASSPIHRASAAASPVLSTAHYNENVSSDVNEWAAQHQHILQQLCEVDNGCDGMLRKIKINLVSVNEVRDYLVARAKLEEQYAKGLAKLSADTFREHDAAMGKKGSWSERWQDHLQVAERVAHQRATFATTLTTIAEDLVTLTTDTDRSRKQLKSAMEKYLADLTKSEGQLDKARSAYTKASREWEKTVLAAQANDERSHQKMVSSKVLSL